MADPKAPDPTGGYRNAPTSAPGSPDPLSPLSLNLPSGGIVAVDCTALRAAVKEFDALSRQAAGPAEAVGAMKTADHPWGEDPMGASFEAGFLPSAEAAQQCLNALVGLFSGLAADLKATHDDFQGADDYSTTVVTNLAKTTGL